MKLSQQRWKGRLDAVIATILQKKVQIQQGCTYNDLLGIVLSSNIFTENEKKAFSAILVNALTETEAAPDPNGEFFGRVDYEYVRKHFPNEIILKLAEDTDFADLYEDELKQARKLRKAKMVRNFKIALPFIAALIIGICIYNLPYFAEKRAYAKTVEAPCIEAFDDYVSRYDNPEHLPDVLYRQAMYCLTGDDYYAYDKARERECIDALSELVAQFPDHELSKKASVTIDSIWNAEIERFTQNNPDITSSNSLTAMYEMLNYMKHNKVYDILLDVKSDVDLIEYSDFSYSIRTLLEEYFPELKTNPVLKIKDYFGTPDQKALEQSLVSEFSKSVNSLFTPDFFTVIIKNDTDTDNLPIINLGYSIKSQVIDMDGITIPNIWTYSSTPQYGSIPGLSTEKHIMGIEVSFNAQLSFPGQTTPWAISVKGEPEEDISNIEDISDGYRVMTRKCFEKFGDELYSLLGLSANQF